MNALHRFLSRSLAFLAAALLCTATLSQTYPATPVRVVVAFTALNWFGIREGKAVQNWLTVAVVAGLIAIVVAGAVPLLLAEANGWNFSYAVMAGLMLIGSNRSPEPET